MDFEVNGALSAQDLALAIEVRIYLEYWPLNITGWPLVGANCKLFTMVITAL